MNLGSYYALSIANHILHYYHNFRSMSRSFISITLIIALTLINILTQLIRMYKCEYKDAILDEASDPSIEFKIKMLSDRFAITKSKLIYLRCFSKIAQLLTMIITCAYRPKMVLF